MTDHDFFYTIDRTATAEFKDRGSKFLAYTYPISSIADFKKCMDDIKKEHPKATHHCFAYRIGLDNNTYRVSDDGEPSGTAGKPILGQIDSKRLTNILVIVVRYFGGTMLGVPGLINAYKTAASLALQLTPAIQKPIEVAYALQFDYSQMNDIMMVVKQLNCTVLEKDMSLFCRLVIGIPKGRIEEAVYKFKEIRNVEITKLVQR